MSFLSKQPFIRPLGVKISLPKTGVNETRLYRHLHGTCGTHHVEALSFRFIRNYH